MNSQFWGSTVLQMSHADSTIMHSAIALGLMGERFQINLVATDDNALANTRHMSAQVQYYKAITRLVKQLDRNDDSTLRSTLMSCSVLICFEFLQGNEEGAIMHLKSGIKILERWLGGSGLNHKRPLPKLKGWDDIDDMVRIFGVLDLQGTNWLGLSSYISPEIIPILLIPPTPTPDAFKSIDEALQHLEVTGYKVCSLQRLFAVKSESVATKDSSEELEMQSRLVLHDLEKWKSALEGFLNAQGCVLMLDDKIRSDILFIHWTCTFVRVAAGFEFDEYNNYAQYGKEFAVVLSTATQLLKPVNIALERNLVAIGNSYNPKTDPMPLFAFCMGLIYPLFFVATKCHDEAVVEKALDLLETDPWREGAWDSCAMAKIAARWRRQLFAQTR